MFGENAPGSPSVLSGLGTPDSAAAQAASLSGFASAALHLVQTVLSTCSGSSFKRAQEVGQHHRALLTCRRLRCCLWEACQKQQQALPISARKTQPCFTLCWFICPKSLWRPRPEQTILKTAPTLTTAPLNRKGRGWGAEYRFYKQGGLGLNLLHLVRGVPTCFYEKRCVITLLLFVCHSHDPLATF